LKIRRAPAAAHAFAIAQAMLRLFATPNTSPIFPAKTLSVIKEVKKLQGYNGSADSKPVGNYWTDAGPVAGTDALALQPYNAMISRHDDSNCLLLRFVRLDFRDFNFIGTRNSVAVCDIESFSLTDATWRSSL
jgi:hypothetical protein